MQEKKAYLLMLAHGEYDDYTRIPIAVVHDFDTAMLIRSAVEEREPAYVHLIPDHIRGYGESYSFSVDIEELPFLSL